MKKALLFVLIFGMSPIFLSAQMFEDLCLTAEGSTSFAMTEGVTETITAVAAPTDDTTSDPLSCTGVGVVSDMFFLFNVPADGFYEMVIDGAGVATGMYCATFGEDCGSMMDLVENQDFNPAITTTCMEFTAGTDYIIGLHVEGSGAADVQFTINSAEPSNDVCDAGNNIMLNSGSLENGTTSCASADTNFGCVSDHVVYYDYTTGADYSEITIELDTDGANNVGMSIWTNCLGTAYDAGGSSVEECDANTDIVLECVPPNTDLIIAIGSADGDEGDFDLTLTELGNPVSNDLCENATSEGTLADDCTLTNISGDNTDACPEIGLSTCSGAIPLADNPVTWHEITLPINTEEVILDAINSGNIEITLFSDCPDNGGGTTGGTTCVSSAPTTFTGLTGGNTYYIAVVSESGMEGAYDFDLLAVEPPGNDDCDFPEGLSGSPLTASNACATTEGGEPFGSCGGDADDATVWFEYTIGNDVQDLTINLTQNGITSNYLIAYDECNGTVLGEDCNGLEVVIDCPVNGDIILIQVGSEFDNAGEFDISVTEGTAIIANDICDAPVDVTPTDVCVFETMSVTTTDMCPEVDGSGDPSDLGTSCNYSDDATSWYSFTTTASTTEVEFDMFTNGGQISVFENDCPVTTVLANCISGNTTITVNGGDTYLIAATIAGTEGDFDFDIKFLEAPDNDDCTDAEVIGMNGSLAAESNLCASTESGESFGCSGATDDATVWYSYEVTTDIQEFTVDLTANGIASNYLVVYDGCGGTLIEEDCGGTSVTIDCPVNGNTYWIQVGSLPDDAGEFDLSVTEGDDKEANDECDAPIDVSPVDVCVFETMTVTTTDMCPEVDASGNPSDLGTGCNYSDDATSWYSFTTLANTTQVEFDNFTGGNISVFDDACPVGAPLADCINGNTLITVTGNTTYLIAATIPGSEGDFDFDIKFIESPDNDLCADAEVLSIGNTLTDESTVCATADVNGLCDNAATSTVWYTYTVPAGGHNELTIDIENFGGVSDDFNVFAINGDCNSTTLWNQADGSTADYCGNSGTELITLSCLVDGDIVTIAVASDPTNEGTFDITINDETDNPDYDTACLDNDLCADADNSLGTITTNDASGETCITDCNTLACPDDEVDALCGGTLFNAVFYEFTTDNDPLLTDGTQVFLQVNLNASCLANPAIAVLEGSCGSYSSFTPIGCLTGDDSGNVDVTNVIQPNTTYTIVVGTTDNEGCSSFDICVQISTGCANDDCVDAITLDDGVQLDTQNTGCTMDATSYNCGNVEESSAWFSFTMPAGTSTMTIDINGGGFSVQVFDGTNGCPPGTGDLLPEGEFCLFTGSEEISCLQEDTEYFIQVSTTMGSEVMFDITVTASPPTNANDVCTAAEAVANGPDCEWFELCFDLEKACPEAQNYGTACTFDEDPVVWYTITLPSNANGIEFQNFDDAGSYGAMFDNDCPPATIYNGGACFTEGDGLTTISNLTPGDTYLLAFGNPTQSEFCVEIRLITPPPGDDPCSDDSFLDDDVVDLGTGGSHSNTTCCAIGSTDDPGQEYANAECPSPDDDAVWYLFEIDPSQDGFVVDLKGLGSTSINIEVLSGQSDAGCTGAFTDLLGSYCGNDNSATLFFTICEDTDPFVWIKVFTEESGCGTFTIDVSHDTGCDNNDDCSDSGAPDLNPVTDLTGEFDFVCTTGCMQFACPEATGDCGFNAMPVVWFQVTPDDDAAQIYANITVLGGSWTPVFAIFEGECPDQTIASTMATPGCNINWPNGNNTDQINQPVQTVIDTYWIAVGADGDPQDINENPNFEICVATTINLIICLGDGSCNPAADFALEDSDIEGQDLGMVDPADAPVLCQGETVEICSEFFYDASATGVDWLIGIVPIFGDGWNLDDFDPSTADVTGNGMSAQWFDEGEAILQEFVGTLCTYTDANGVLQLCNILCGTCPCTPGLPAQSELPGGWFWIQDGAGPECDNDGTPGESYGIGSTTANVEFCFELTVREDFADETECNQADLTIGFQTFSDGVAGCWEDPVGECLLDEAQEITFNLQCNVPPEVWVEGAPCPAPDRICPYEVCTGGQLDINVELEDGSSLDIEIVFDDLGTGVTGGNNFTFPGFGTIDDVLVNPTTSPQVVEYTMMSNDPDNICPGVSTTIEVTVYPEIEYDLEELEECENENNVTVTVNPNGGTGNYVDFEWSNGESTQQWILSQPIADGLYTYNVTVTDDLGCTGTMDVEVTIHPEVVFDFEDGPTEFCQGDLSGNDCFVYFMPTPLESGVDADDYFWTVDFTGLETDDLDEEELEVNICDSDPGTYLIMLEITDENGCVGTNEFELSISEGPEANVTWLDQACDEDDGSYDIQIVSNDLVSITIYDDEMPPNIVWGPTGFTGNETATVADGGTYTIELLDVNDCSGTETIVIDPPMGTPIVISGNSPVCLEDLATIQVDNAGDYTTFTWSDANASTGSSISTDTITSNTTYAVTATDASGCASTAVYEVVVNPLPVAQINGSLSYCTNSFTTLTATGGTMYSWSGPGGATSSIDQIVVTTPGTYTVIVTDDNNCTSTESVDVIEDANLSPVIAGTNICDGSTTTLDAGIFTMWQWFDPSGTPLGTSQTQDVSAPGIYSVEVQDASGCTGSGTFEVMEFSTPTVNVEIGEVCNIDTGNGPTTLDLSSLVSGSTGVFLDESGVVLTNTMIDFAGPITTENFTFMTNTAILPCVDIEVPVVVNVISCDCPQVQTDLPNPICSNDSPFDLTSLELAAIGDGDWFFTDGTPVPNEEYDPALGSGTVIFTLDPSLQGGGNCDSDFPIMIEVQQAVSAVVDPATTTVCNDGTSGMSTFVDLSNFVSGDVGEWTDPMNNVVTDTEINFAGIPVNSTFTYTYCTTGAVAPCDNVCDELIISVVDCNCPPVVTDAPAPLCNDNGGLSLLTLENDVPSGTWSVVDGPQTITLTGGTFFDATGVTAGVYEVCFTVDNPAGGGCPENSCEFIEVGDAPSATVTPTAVVCSDPMGDGDTFLDFTSLVTAGDMDGVWTDNNGTGVDLSDYSNVSFVGVDPTNTTYLFTYTTNSAVAPCQEQSYEVVITVSDCLCPTVAITNPNVVCNDNDMLNLDDYITTIETGFWVDANGNTINNILDISEFDPTAYTFLFVLDPPPADPECDTEFSLILDVVSPNNPGEPNPDIFHICADEIDIIQLPDLIDPNSNPDVGGVWVDDPSNDYNGSPFDSNGATFDPNGQDPGTYLFTYGWFDNPPCDDVGATITIVIDPAPLADAGPDGLIDCDTPEAILDGTSSAGAQPLVYQWAEISNGVTIANPNSPIITVTEPGTYVLEIIDDNGCEDSDMASVTSDPNLPILSLDSSSPVCPGDSPGTITISNVQGGTEPYLYSIDGINFVSDLSFLNLDPGPYTITLQDANGCESTASALITPPNNPLVTIDDNLPILSLGDSVTIINSINFMENDVASVTWTVDGEELSTNPFYTGSLSVTPENPSTVYCILITDSEGCITEDCVTIRTQQINNVYIANVISTNSESGNESLFVQSPNVEKVTDFYVYDRWGELIFKIDEETDPNDPDAGWKGLFKEERVVSGVYSYLIKVRYFDETDDVFVGNVTVLH